MSRKKRVTRRLSDDEELVLCDGGGIISFTTLDEVFGTLENAREAWRVHGERLTADYGRAGSKPWGWWQFTATEAEKDQQKEVERAFLEQQQRELRSQPARDPADGVVKNAKVLHFPAHDANGTGNHN